jgi:hypothetical protein
MMPAISERTEDWRAGLRFEAESMRQLWAAVALTAVNEAAHEVRKARVAKDTDRVDSALRRFRAWAVSADGRIVLQLAGLNHSARAVDLLCDKVLRGEPPAYTKHSHKGRPHDA